MKKEQNIINNVNKRKKLPLGKLPLGKLPLGNIMYLCSSPMFLSDTESLAPSQLEMLRAIKDGVQQLSSVEAKNTYALGNPNTISKNKKVLRDKDIIEERKGKLWFVDPVYRLWFSQEY